MLANKWLDDAGLAAHAVSLKVLVPLLEYSSLEDDIDEAGDPAEAKAMHERWAALLANAAAGDAGARVPPGFPRILSEIEALDARLLDTIARGGRVSFAELLESHGIDSESDETALHRVQVRIDNLERLQLCTVYRPDPELIAYARSVEAVERAEQGWPLVGRPLSEMFKPQRHQPTISRTVEITALGEAFVEACTPPAGTQTGKQGG